MNNREVLTRLESSHAYYMRKKDTLFAAIEETKQQLESIQADMEEKKKYIDIQTKQERAASNIFSLYDTTNQYMEEIEQLQTDLEAICTREEKTGQRLASLEQELEEVTAQIISNQIMQNDFKKTQSPVAAGETATASQEELPPKTIEDIRKRLQFCRDILDLDPKRCSLELTMLLNDLT